jgi:SAM-dependent methyltransferase
VDADTHCERVIDVFSAAAATYETVGPRQFSFFARKLVEFVDVGLACDVLDVATGTGAVLVAVAQRGTHTGRLVGVDVVPEMLARAHEEIGRSLQAAELERMDGERLAFGDGSFDFVLCSFGVQAFVDKQAALVGFHRVLRDRGRVGIVYPLGWPFETDPRWGWQGDILKSFGALEETGEDFEPPDLRRAMEAAGFREVETMEVTCPLQFNDANEWWAWTWSHGTRSLLERVPTASLPELRAALTSRIDSCREADGVIHGSMSALLARGRKDSEQREPKRLSNEADPSHRSPLQSGSV